MENFKMNCLDTYALVEIRNNNPKYAGIINQDFIIPDLTLAEFYWVMLRDVNLDLAEHWYKKLKPFVKMTNIGHYKKAMDFRKEHRKLKLSFFDCLGYVTARENNCKFVTGDKEFRNKEGVLFISST